MARASAKELKAAAKKLGVPLPDEYSAFLRDSGPAPGGTLLPLASAIAHETLRLDLPFPFTKQDASRILALRAKGEVVFLEPEDSVGGVIPIADGGCNDVTYLVLTGPLRGTVWSGGEPGWVPHARSDGTLLGFREWLTTVADEPLPVPAPPKKNRVAKTPAPPVFDRASYQLNLRNQGLASLPDEVMEMTKVGMIYLGGNALTHLPPSFRTLGATVVALELGPNPLGELPADILSGFGKVTVLDVKETAIKHLPEVLTTLPIRELYLDRNPDLDVEQALAVAARIPTLKWLGLGSCGLTCVPAGVSALRQIERLYLNDNSITTLPPDLAALQLEILGVMNNEIQTVPDVLEPRVRALYFAGNPGTRAEKKRFDAIRKGFVAI